MLALVIGMFHPVNEPFLVQYDLGKCPHCCHCLRLFRTIRDGGNYMPGKWKSLVGWVWLAFSCLQRLWMTLVCGFSFVEAFILPHLATESPALVESILGMFTSVPGTVDLGVLPIVWNTSGLLIILGPLLFGIATFRARVLPRWAGGFLALAAVLVPVGGMVPTEYQPEFVMIPLGLAVAWLGFTLVFERREKSVESVIANSAQPASSRTA